MTFQEQIGEHAVGAGRLYTLKTRIEDVVSWRGIVVANPQFERGDDLVMHLMVNLLDKGTKRRDRFEIADVLENRGAQLGYEATGIRLGFWGRALRRDVPTVLGVMAEQLREPLFDQEEFEKARQRMLAAVRRNMENTGSQAAGALLRQLYPPDHPNYSIAEEDELEQLQRVTLDDVVAFYDRHIGANELNIVMVGDVDEYEAREAVDAGLAEWPAREAPPRYAVSALESLGGRRVVRPMIDRKNLDVRMGHAVRMRRDDPAYPALFLANQILGGTFSSRLMDIIRDDMGLTYGIYSGLAGISTRYEGHWRVSVTLSQENLERGIEATIAEVRRFVEEGPTARELEEHITTLTGSFKVKLATTSGLAATILTGVRNGFGTRHLDDWPARIEALTEADVRTAIRRHFHPDRFDVAIAGTLP
ncbi:MAG: pitrilysin family protein [Rhodothermales bacterium]